MPRTVADLPTPALVVDVDALDHNIAAMSARWPGPSLRPHVKAFKSTALAARLAAAGHEGFCCATIREMEGMAEAGLGTDLLLANEVLDASRLGSLVDRGARVTVAVDSDATIDAAARGGVKEVLIDINVGLPRCGCPVGDAGRLAELARARGLDVRGVMGYEGHAVGIADRRSRVSETAKSMSLLARAHAEVGGSVVSGGGTGTWDCNPTITELQAGSYTLMDTTYATLGMPFRQALSCIGQVVSTNPDGYAVADVGLKSLGMDHGDPSIAGFTVWFCSDEHITFATADDSGMRVVPKVGDKVQVWPAHVDPTVAYHQRFHLVSATPGDPAAPITDAEVLDTWPIDLRHW